MSESIQNLTDFIIDVYDEMFNPSIFHPAHTIWRRGAIPSKSIAGEQITVPTFELAAYPSVKLSEIKARRFNIIDSFVTTPATAHVSRTYEREYYAED